MSNSNRANSREAKARAEATFKRREQQSQEGVKAWEEYKAQRLALTANTERLRALRLAKEAAEAAAVNQCGRPTKRQSPPNVAR